MNILYYITAINKIFITHIQSHYVLTLLPNAAATVQK